MPNITDRFVKSCKVPASGYIIHGDDVNRGFGVRVNSNGTRSFCLAYTTTAGRERRFKLGDWPAMSAQDARKQALTLREAIRQGGDPVRDRETLLHSETVSDLAAKYLQCAEKKLRPGTLRTYRGIMANVITPSLGKLKVKAVTRDDIETLHGSLRSTPFHANRALAVLSAMFNFAIGAKLCETNPVKGVQRYDEPARETWLSFQQLQGLEAALAAYPDQTAADALRLLIVTGSRENEVLTARWADFDLKRGVWTKPSHHTKQRKTEHLPLSKAALLILSGLHKRTGAGLFLFPGKDGSRRTLRKPWLQVLRSAGLASGEQVPGRRRIIWTAQVRLHDLRHTFASHLVSQGAPLMLVGKLLGHTSAATTQRYAHVDNQSLKDVANRFPLLSGTVN
jgi:integrase